MSQYQPDDFGQGQEQQYEQPIDGAALLAELIAKPAYKESTSYVPFQGTPDNEVKLSPAIVLQFFAKPTKSGKLCTYEQAVRFIMLCKARKLDPREGDAFLVGYDTKNGPEFHLITAHQAFLKRAEANGEFDGMTSGITVCHDETEDVKDIEGEIIPDGCRLIGGWARVYRRDRKHETYRRLDLRAFDKGISVWGTNKAGMIAKCAEADALRSTFPNSLGGMYMAGEVQPSDAPRVESPAHAPAPSAAVQAAVKQSKKQPSPTGAAPAPSAAAPAQTTPAAPVGSTAEAATAAAAAPASFPAGNPTPAPTTEGAGSPTPAPSTMVKCLKCGAQTAPGTCQNCGMDPATPSAAASRPNKGQQARAQVALEVAEMSDEDVLAFLMEAAGSGSPAWTKAKVLQKYAGTPQDADPDTRRKLTCSVKYYQLVG